MIERELSNVVTVVVMEGENPRSAMDEAIKRIKRRFNENLKNSAILKTQAYKGIFDTDIDTVKGWVSK